MRIEAAQTAKRSSAAREALEEERSMADLQRQSTAEERARQEAGLRARQSSLDREQLEEARTQADLAAAKKKAQAVAAESPVQQTKKMVAKARWANLRSSSMNTATRPSQA